MRNFTFAAAALAVTFAAAPASADTVIFSKTGMIHADAFTQTIALDGAGIYDVQFSSTANADYSFTFGYDYHYDIFLAPAPRPHSENIFGSNGPSFQTKSAVGTSFSYAFEVPEMTREYFISDAFYVPYGAPLGSEVYKETRYENPYIRAQVWPSSFDDGTYSVTITRRDPVQGVPEPSAWALMILGFGAAGAALRRRPLAA